MYDHAALAAAFLGLLRPKLEAVMATRLAAQARAAAHGRDAVAIANTTFAAERAAVVVGRDAELARIMAYMTALEDQAAPFVVAGPAGSGKSTLLAEVAG